MFKCERGLKIILYYIRTYCIALVASNEGLSSQLGFIMIMSRENNTSIILNFDFCKKRATRRIQYREICTLKDASEDVCALKYALERILQRLLPIPIFTEARN